MCENSFTWRSTVLGLLFLCLASGGLSQVSQSDDELLRIVNTSGQARLTIPWPGTAEMDILTRNVSILSVRNGEVHLSLSPLDVNWFILRKYKYTLDYPSGTKGILSASDLSQVSEWDVYPTYAQYIALMQAFASDYPALCRLDTIGTSMNGKLVLALKISDNAKIDEEEPEVFYSSTMHGDETSGYILMLRLADYLLKNYNSSARVKELADNLEIWINPLANPDGAYRNGNTIDNTSTRYNANGYDLNRNFPDPVTPYTPSHVQQKETADMISFLREHRFILSANFHSGEEVVNYPWDRWLSRHHADETWFHTVSRAYADTVHKYSGPGYMNVFENGIVRGAVWYIVYGGRQDFVTWELQGREVTIELDDSFITPSAQLPLLWEYNYRSLLEYLGNALYGIHGNVNDKESSAPVPARIYIAGHDIDSSHIYTDTLSGSFVRLLSPGTWDLTFSARGYRDTIVTNVAVYQQERTDVSVLMKPLISTIDTTLPPVAILYPNPASAEIKAIIDSRLEGQVRIRIYNASGMLIMDYVDNATPDLPLVINVSDMAGGTYTAVFNGIRRKLSAKSRFVVIK